MAKGGADMFSGKDDKDDFWDISKLLPKKYTTPSRFSTKEKTVDFELPSKEAEIQPKSNENKLTVTESRAEGDVTVYRYENGLIRSVSITRFVDKYDFYGNFRKAALVYYDYKTPKSDFAPFYSYMPQYSQLTVPQKNFYFYWRDSVRRGKYIKTDYSYLYLYAYEILNLPDKIGREQGLDMLTELWSRYRNDLPNIDAYFSLWVQDYCLLYNLPCPTEKIASFIFDAIGAAEFKEFYLSDAGRMGTDGLKAMLAYLSDYDWQKGKYAGGDNKDVYSKHLLGAMSMLVKKLWNSGELTSLSNETARISRSAFRHSLCTHSVKCRIDIEYMPLSKAETLRNAVTATIKYTENKLRALLGVKSRLAIKYLPDSYKAEIDGYFDRIFEKVNRERIKASMPEYERLYDAVEEKLSFEGADEIERASWSNTARLVVSEDEEEIIAPEPAVPIEIPTENDGADTYGLSVAHIEFIKAVLSADADAACQKANEIGDIIESVCEQINEAFADGFGDVIIEGEYPELRIIEDYEEDIKEWLSRITK